MSGSCGAGELTWFDIAGLGISLSLAVFGLRRVGVVVTALRAPQPASRNECHDSDLPCVLILAPMRNEQTRASILLNALEKLDYPESRRHIVLGNDGSTDQTLEMLKSWAGNRAGVEILSFDRPSENEALGKAALLDRMMKNTSFYAPFVAVYDAKHGPKPDSLRRLISLIQADPHTGAVAGYLEPRNTDSSLVSIYASLESWVNQLIHHQGKEGLGLSSPTLGGNCVYRREALLAVGGFPAGAYSEDTEVSLAMQAAHWRTRFLASAVASNEVVDGLGSFWRQRMRWNRGLQRSARLARSPESWATALGYADRLLLIAALVWIALGYLPSGVLLLYAVAPVFQIVAAIQQARRWGSAVSIFLAVVVMLPVDLAVTLWSYLGVSRVSWR